VAEVAAAFGAKMSEDAAKHQLVRTFFQRGKHKSDCKFSSRYIFLSSSAFFF
jgi:hypothetical protein